jgi:hypothetical protein
MFTAFMPRRGYLLVAKANHMYATGVAGCFWEAMKTLTPELAAGPLRFKPIGLKNRLPMAFVFMARSMTSYNSKTWCDLASFFLSFHFYQAVAPLGHGCVVANFFAAGKETWM